MDIERQAEEIYTQAWKNVGWIEGYSPDPLVLEAIRLALESRERETEELKAATKVALDLLHSEVKDLRSQLLTARNEGMEYVAVKLFGGEGFYAKQIRSLKSPKKGERNETGLRH